MPDALLALLKVPSIRPKKTLILDGIQSGRGAGYLIKSRGFVVI
jgi:hypothetical protein